MPELWAGTDAGKAEHHCVVIDADGQRKLSRRVANDESTLLQLIGDVLALTEGEPVTWAIDLNAGGAALMIALLTDNGQQVLYIPGRTVHHARASSPADGHRNRFQFRLHPHLALDPAGRRRPGCPDRMDRPCVTPSFSDRGRLAIPAHRRLREGLGAARRDGCRGIAGSVLGSGRSRAVDRHPAAGR